MRFTEKVGEAIHEYEGTPEEIAELRARLDQKFIYEGGDVVIELDDESVKAMADDIAKELTRRISEMTFPFRRF